MIVYKNALLKQKVRDFIECDICDKRSYYKGEDDKNFYEAFNFVEIKKEFSYGSKIGDGKTISIDLCEDCFLEMFKDFVEDKVN